MDIVEVKNDKYKIKKIIMTNDAEIDGTELPLPTKYNFFMLLVGRPGSGKTTFAINLINKRKKNTFYKKFDKVYIFSNSFKTISEDIKLSPDRIYDGIEDLEKVVEEIKETEDKTLILLDDCVSDIKDVVYMQKLIYNRRHIGGGVSLIITTQIYNKLPLNLRKCATDLLFWATTNKKEYESIFNDYINLTKENWAKLLKYVFKEDPHNFLWFKADEQVYYKNFNRLMFEDN
jgi:adenylate kinase family enzyme